MSDEQVRIHDALTMVQRVNAGASLPLVLVHGVGGNHHTFDALLPFLGELDVVMPCMPGRGGSSGAPPANAAEAARWLLAVLQHLGLHRVVLAGHSWGGGIVIETALAAGPGVVVRGLGLLSTGARLRVHPDILARFAREAPTNDKAALELADWTACNTFDRLNDVQALRMETLILSGDVDAFIPPKYGAFLASRLPCAEQVLLPGVGHMIHEEQPSAVALQLRRLLTRASARDARPFAGEA